MNQSGEILECETPEIRHIHGTIIALVIRHICKNVQYISMNILDENLTTNGEVLIHSLHEALKYEPDIIHLSLGTRKIKYMFKFKKVIKEASENNLIIVSSANNQGLVSYPAYLKGVVGVKSAKLDINQYMYKNGFFYAPGGTEGIAGIEDIYCISPIMGTSISAAYITGHIANLKYSNDGIKNKEIIKSLINGSLGGKGYEYK